MSGIGFQTDTNVDDAQRLAGVYVGRILRGAKPADLPVQQEVKVEQPSPWASAGWSLFGESRGAIHFA